MVLLRTPFALVSALLIIAGFAATTHAGTSDPSPGTDSAAAGKMTGEDTLQSLEEVKSQDHGPMSRSVLEFLTIMDAVVNKAKQPPITAEDWAPLGALVDRDNFHRVGNFGEHVNWPQYVELLVGWANSSWWKGYLFRLREVPATQDKPGLVYLESEERSNPDHPVTEDGDYSTLPSIAVYQFDDEGKINALHVYDQRPL